MLTTAAIASLSLLATVSAQQVGTNQAEVHPKLASQKCTTAGGCVAQDTSIVLDANWRWLHSTSGYNNCYTGQTWDASLCPDDVTCAKNCALEGANYAGTYGITTSGNALTLKFVTGANIGSRVYLMNTDTTYNNFQLLNQEFTFDVDMSNLPCGLNGALYFTEMPTDGGISTQPNNKAGAKYGTGYCDAQCPHDLKFIGGEANVEGWTPSATDRNSGKGKYGTCCSEMDIWEANQEAAAYTPHPCKTTGLLRCTGTDCGDGSERYSSVCDKDGCDFNAYRQGNTGFLGLGKIVDTKSKFTVVTQFITSTGTASGTLTEIRRLYVQNGKVIGNANNTIAGIPSVNSITDNFCTAQKTAFGDQNVFSARGGLAAMGQAMARGMVLSMSLWDDHDAQALWLDSNYPVGADPSKPGVARGPCATTSGVPSEVEASVPNSSVTFSNIRWGDIGSTYSGTASTPAPGTSTITRAATTSTTSTATTSTRSSSSAAASASSSAGTALQYAQCGGLNWSGATGCVSPFTCKVINDYYSQCQ